MQKQQFSLNRDVIYQGVREPTIELKQGTSLTVRQVNSVFHMGMWRFESENQLIFQPITSLFQRIFPLTVSLIELDTVYKFRAEQILEFERVFLDGIIQIKDELLVLDGIYSLSTPSEPLQIARIVQELEPTSLSINEFEQYAEQAKSSSVGSDKKLAPSNAEAIQLEIEAIQLVKNYSVILNGSTESDTFNDLEAILYFTFSSEGERPNHIQLTTKRILESQHGDFYWICEPLEQCSERDWYFVTEAESDSSPVINIDLNYQESRLTTNCIWYSKAENDSQADVFRATGERITADLTINGDRIEGNISASGQYIDSQTHSTYQATIVGEIEKSRQVEELRHTLDSENANFTGCWLTEISTIEKIELQQYGNEVNGTYYLDNRLSGQIRGNVEGNFLEFNWTDGEQKGWGYFRSLNQGGTLAGMWGIDDFPNEPQVVVANWQLLINLEAASQKDEIFLRELRWLGHELIIQQRFEQGITILEEILRLYRDRRHNLCLSQGEEFDYSTSQEELSYLHNEAFTLVGFVLRCNVYLGNYHKLISNLDHLTEVIHLLSAEESAGRLFRERTASIWQNAIEAKQRFQMFVSGLESNKYLLENESERGVIGIYFNCQSEPGNIVIEKVLKDSSAKAAGILAGDILVRVGETKVRDISRRECYDLLTGEPNTLVNIIVKRKDEEITFNIPRKSHQIYPVHRQLELTNLIEHLKKYHVALRDLAETKLNRIEKLNFDIVQGKIDFIEAWTILSNNLAVLGETINSKIEELLELKETLFIEYSNFLEDVGLSINIMIDLRDNIINQNNFGNSNLEAYAPQIIELDSKIENFLQNNPQLSQIETISFRCYLHSFQAVNDLYLSIHLEQNFMSKIDIIRRYEENQKSSQISLHSLTQHIERWRGKLVEDLEKIDALQQAQPLFAKVLEMSVALGDAKEALIFSEKSRARAFADLLTTRFEDNADRGLEDTPVTSPEINFEQIKQIAKKNSATVVEYFVVKKEESEVKIYIWVIQPNGNTVLETVELDSSSQQQHFLSSLVTRTRASFGVSDSNSNTLDSSFPNDTAPISIDLSAKLENSQALLAELYQLLIKPIEFYLDYPLVEKVILVPHGSLFLLPFASLFNPKTKEYLIERHSIILSPALQALNLTQQNFTKNDQAENKLNNLIVGNPKMPFLGSPPKSLAKLPYAEMAAKAIAKLLLTKPLLDTQATKKEVLAQFPNAKIIHFGTHGEFNNTQPLKGWIALAPKEKEGGFLTVEEILALFAPPQAVSLNAELVVLSACNTGRGQITGDGVIGLARGLMASGVKAVLVSLWDVRDFPTACLMVQFYKYLLSESTPNKALKKAQMWLKNITNKELKIWIRKQKLPLSTRQKIEVQNWLPKQQDNLYPFQHPFYWGAFYLIGA